MLAGRHPRGGKSPRRRLPVDDPVQLVLHRGENRSTSPLWHVDAVTGGGVHPIVYDQQRL